MHACILYAYRLFQSHLPFSFINSHCNDKKFQFLNKDTSILVIRTLEVGPDGVRIRGYSHIAAVV